jgi:hypothetical protein
MGGEPRHFWPQKIENHLDLIKSATSPLPFGGGVGGGAPAKPHLPLPENVITAPDVPKPFQKHTARPCRSLSCLRAFPTLPRNIPK